MTLARQVRLCRQRNSKCFCCLGDSIPRFLLAVAALHVRYAESR